MRVRTLLLVIASGSDRLSAATLDVSLEPDMVNPGYAPTPDWFKKSFLDIREDVVEAAAVDKRLILYFYQDGCSYCAKLIGEDLADQRLIEQTQAGFEVVAINLQGDREVTDFEGVSVPEKVFARSMCVQLTPTRLSLKEAGRVVLRINGYFPSRRMKVALEYVAGRHERQGEFSDFLIARAPVAASGELYAIGASLPRATAGRKPIATWCCSSSNASVRLVTCCIAMCCEGARWRRH